MDMDTSYYYPLTTFVALIFLFLIIVILHFLFHKHVFKHLPLTPFPSLPIIGHLYLFLFFFFPNNLPFHRALSALSRRHPHAPVLFLYLGARPALLVSSSSAARQCFTGRNDIAFANRPHYLLNGKHLGYNFTSLAWSPYGPLWRNLRSISALHLLSFHKLHALSTIRAHHTRSMLLKLLHLTQTSNNYIDMRKLLFQHTYNVAAGMIRGKTMRDDDDGCSSSSEAEAFREIVEEMSRVTLEANAVDFVPIVRWVGFGEVVERKMRLVQEKRDKFMRNVLERWLQEDQEEEEVDHVSSAAESGGGQRKRARSLIQILMELKRAEPEKYSDDTIRNLVLVLLQGASHAAANTLEWAFSRLFQNPHVLATARSHIDSALQNNMMAETDLPKLPYIRHIIQETLRMHPPAPLLTPHISSERCRVGEFQVPRGTMLLVNVWEIHNNPGQGGVWKEPEKFKPER